MVYLLILLAGFSRVISHPANFTALGGVGLFGGKYLDKKTAIVSVIFIMLFTDIIIGLYSFKIMIAVYLSLIISAFLGQNLKKKFTTKKLFVSILASSFIFFIMTNLAVFFFSGMYTLNFSGLVRCFTLAIPFYRNMFLGDIFYSTILFGTYELYNRSKIKNKLLKINFKTNN